MSSGVALSTPRGHLNNIEMTIKDTGLFAATARIRYGAAAQAYPLGSLLTVMGRKTIPLLEENGEITERIHSGLRSEPAVRHSGRPPVRPSRRSDESRDQTRTDGREGLL